MFNNSWRMHLRLSGGKKKLSGKVHFNKEQKYVYKIQTM